MEYLTLRTFDNYINANIYLTKLQAEEIDCYLKDEFTSTMIPIWNQAIGGIKLCVNETQVNKAETVLLLFDDEQKQNQRCPKCHSLNVQFIAKPKSAKNILFALATWFLSNYAISAKNVYHCYNCGFEFDEISYTKTETNN